MIAREQNKPAFHCVVNPAYTTMSPDRETVLSFDREGRMIGFFQRGMTYRRSLDSRVVVRWREQGKRKRRWLTNDKTIALFKTVYGLAENIFAEQRGTLQAKNAVSTDASNISSNKQSELLHRLATEILRWTPEKLLAQREAFHAVYTPIPILPPDQYKSIVLQATHGCTWNRCTFCNFYQGQRFQLRPIETFEEHIQGVLRFLGEGIRLRNGIFLGDGNALALKPRRLVAYIDLIKKYLPQHPLYGFVDVFSGERHTRDEWKTLADLGLKRVYIGMETGYDPLLAFLNKPGSQQETIALVHDMKAAGLNVSLIVMVGIGGHEFKEQHTKATVEALRAMPLEKGDLLYLSPFVEHTESEYSRRRQEQHLHPMSEEEVEAALQSMAKQTRALNIQTGRYDIRDFLY